jgi:hypothetical protein
MISLSTETGRPLDFASQHPAVSVALFFALEPAF